MRRARPPRQRDADGDQATGRQQDQPERTPQRRHRDLLAGGDGNRPGAQRRIREGGEHRFALHRHILELPRVALRGGGAPPGAGQRADQPVVIAAAGHELAGAIDDAGKPPLRHLLLAQDAQEALRIERDDHVVDRLAVAHHRDMHARQRLPVHGADKQVGDLRPAGGDRPLVRDPMADRRQGLAERLRRIDQLPALGIDQQQPRRGQELHRRDRALVKLRQIARQQRARGGERIGDRQMLVDLGVDRLGERVGGGQDGGALRRELGLRELIDADRGRGDQRQRHQEDEQDKTLTNTSQHAQLFPDDRGLFVPGAGAIAARRRRRQPNTVAQCAKGGNDGPCCRHASLAVLFRLAAVLHEFEGDCWISFDQDPAQARRPCA